MKVNNKIFFRLNGHHNLLHIGIHLYNDHKLIYQLIVSSISGNINDKGCGFEPMIDEHFFKRENFDGNIQTTNGYFLNPSLINIKKEEEKKNHMYFIYNFLMPTYSNPFVVLHYQ